MNLLKQHVRFGLHCERLLGLVTLGLQHRAADPSLYECCITTAIIRLHDQWAAKCRHIILLSAYGRSNRRCGVRLARASSIASGETPLDVLRRTWSPRRAMPKSWEPHWYDPKDAIRAASLLGLANEPEITTALSAGTTPEILRIVRNAVAHTLPHTLIAFRSRAGLTVRDPLEYAVSINVTNSQLYISQWVDDLKSMLWSALA